MSLHKHIDTIVHALHLLGVKQWVISPGSRNAPIVASIAKSKLFTLVSAPDERSAAFMALGANQAGVFTAALCTSGTAVLNYYPAVAEAFYAQVPLLLVTADRPAESIDQWDGQCIRQVGVFDKHCKKSYSIASNLHTNDCLPQITELINNLNQDLHTADYGPIHINLAIHEPIYLGVEDSFAPLNIQIEPIKKSQTKIEDFIANQKYKRIMVFAGELSLSEAAYFKTLQSNSNIVFLAEKHSKLHQNQLAYWENEVENICHLAPPDLLITIGKNWVNKTLKNWIKDNKPTHWHLHTNKYVGNPFFYPQRQIAITSEQQVLALFESIQSNTDYYLELTQLCKNVAQNVENKLTQDTELGAINHIFNLDYQTIHLGNSSIVRKAALIASNKTVYGNRGTSGIDGSVATAIGFALSQTKSKHACIVGDISMLYESNSLWVKPYPNNLHIYVINNGGGKIFKQLDGPQLMPAGIEYITTPHTLAIKHLAALHQLPHGYSLATHAVTGGITEVVCGFN